MKNGTKIFGTILIVLLTTSLAFGHASYTGYSGAPGTRGACAGQCHGSNGGTIQVSGFPTQYISGQAYTITISHNGGTTIRQFNGSCRIGTGSQNAGVIAAGTRTSIYSATGETNGVKLTSTNQNDGTFSWTAPASGSGDVKLYISGLQGNYSGLNTELVLTSSEQTTGIDELVQNPSNLSILSNYPNPFNAVTTIYFSTSTAGPASLNIYNLVGQKVASLYEGNISTGEHYIHWDANKYPSGVYFCRLALNGQTITRQLTLLK